MEPSYTIDPRINIARDAMSLHCHLRHEWQGSDHRVVKMGLGKGVNENQVAKVVTGKGCPDKSLGKSLAKAVVMP